MKAKPAKHPRRVVSGGATGRRKAAVRSATAGERTNGLTARLVRIGNSRGIRLPKAVIEQAGLTDRVEITVEGERVILRPAASPDPRAGWEEQIKAALAEHGDDIEDWRDWQAVPNKFDEEEWQW